MAKKVDPRLLLAAQPTRDRLHRLATGVPEKSQLLLLQISKSFFDANETITSMRHQAGLTEWHLKLFQRELGLSPKDLLRECRLETALQLLHDPSITVAQVASLVGYTKRNLELLVRDLWDLSPAELGKYLQEIRSDQQAQSDELRSWYFWVRLHRGEIDIDDARAALTYLQNRLSSV